MGGRAGDSGVCLARDGADVGTSRFTAHQRGRVECRRPVCESVYLCALQDRNVVKASLLYDTIAASDGFYNRYLQAIVAVCEAGSGRAT
jgi:hypothetical protein